MANLVGRLHLHPIVDHFTIALLFTAVGADLFAAAFQMLASRRQRYLEGASRPLASTGLLLAVAGALAAVGSYLTGDIEADRVWDSLSPAAQQILAPSSPGRAQLLAHAQLGQYLMYAFLVLAAWRVTLEFWKRLRITRLAYLAVASLAICGLMYQGMTGGELVYEHGAGISAPASAPAAEK